jgi:hypothetical protein
MDPVETYITELRDIRASGAAVKETSYYPALSALLNELGKSLKPRVRCIINIKNKGAGIPDGGLFTPDQFQKASSGEPLQGQAPSRGAIEAKGTGDDVFAVADGEQVQRYLQRYRQVLVTNYRAFVLVGFDHEGRAASLESYSLAVTETEFWAAAAHPKKMAEQHGERLAEYLKRVMRHAAPIATPQDLAWFLASYARDARSRIESVELPALAAVRTALEEALGIKFEGVRGEHFFRSTLVQTLFYGVFSAWVLWSKQHPLADRKTQFDWRVSAHYLRVPIMRKLFGEVADPGQMRELSLYEVLDWSGATLNRVERPAFFKAFEESHAVQYFYEPFLEAFDPDLRKQLGVWYTPIEIVHYMVARVDTVLRTELGIETGLADPRVYVLDPCCGTGAYLVEVLKRIDKTLTESGADALAASDVKEAALKRVFGFEILPAPFVVAHLQVGLLLQNLGAELSEKDHERVSVYLTNALTGWEPPKGPKTKLPFPELEEERDAAEHVKRDKPILVILGNPPYNAFAGVSPQEEDGLVEPYKEGLISKWGIKKFNLDDLYIRFFRLAERRLAEKTGEGVMCYVSNFSYLGDPSFVVMRERFLQEFDSLWFDCMNGDSRETGKLTPDGRPDPSIFSTEYNHEGIRVGTAIGLMARRIDRSREPIVRFRQFWGATKRKDVLTSLCAEAFEKTYTISRPGPLNRFSFRPLAVAEHYLEWPKVVDLALKSGNGLMEKRGGALIDIDPQVLTQRMQLYYDLTLPWDELRRTGHGLAQDAAGFDAQKVRPKVLKAERFDPDRVVRYAVRPFDTRWCYYSDVSPLWNRSRPALWAQLWPGNSFLLTRFKRAREPEGAPFYFTAVLSDDHFLSPDAIAIPMQLRTAAAREKRVPEQDGFFEAAEAEADKEANLRGPALAYLDALGIDSSAPGAYSSLIWMHALAIGYAPLYLHENSDGLGEDWPRIPLPTSRGRLEQSAELGTSIACLLDTEQPVTGVTTGQVRRELAAIGMIRRAGGGTLNPVGGDLDLTAGWGHAGKDGITMPGKGKLSEREYTAAEVEAIKVGAVEQGLSFEQAMLCLGDRTYDVFLNETAYWKSVPVRVWSYTIGGYQVIKKWLSYREKRLLGRGMSKEEAREVMEMARRIAALLLMEPALDKNYLAIKESAFDWQSLKSG